MTGWDWDGEKAAQLIDDRHALYVGWVMGSALRADLPVLPMLDADGNYTAALTLNVRHGVRVLLIVPPPPDDWEPT